MAGAAAMLGSCSVKVVGKTITFPPDLCGGRSSDASISSICSLSSVHCRSQSSAREAICLDVGACYLNRKSKGHFVRSAVKGEGDEAREIASGKTEGDDDDEGIGQIVDFGEGVYNSSPSLGDIAHGIIESVKDGFEDTVKSVNGSLRASAQSGSSRLAYEGDSKSDATSKVIDFPSSDALAEMIKDFEDEHGNDQLRPVRGNPHPDRSRFTTSYDDPMPVGNDEWGDG